MNTVTKFSDSLTNSFLESNRDSLQKFINTPLYKEGASILQENGLPAPKEEEYKFTPISKKLKEA